MVTVVEVVSLQDRTVILNIQNRTILVMFHQFNEENKKKFDKLVVLVYSKV